MMAASLFPEQPASPFNPREAFGDQSEQADAQSIDALPQSAGSAHVEVGDEPFSRQTLAARLARFFRECPGEWVDGEVLAGICGRYGWRTRVSDIRRAPFSMVIKNRQYKRGKFTVSEYRYVTPSGGRSEAV